MSNRVVGRSENGALKAEAVWSSEVKNQNMTSELKLETV